MNKGIKRLVDTVEAQEAKSQVQNKPCCSGCTEMLCFCFVSLCSRSWRQHGALPEVAFLTACGLQNDPFHQGAAMT